MGAESIYTRLTGAGLSPAGACGLMGNMQAESAMRANNAQDGFSYSDEDYTAKADALLLDFAGDGIGYGLCQWTYAPRKQKLLEYARRCGLSLGDEDMQVDFCVAELREDYPGLYAFLCATQSVFEAAHRVCVEYERPVINNVDVRAKAGEKLYGRFGEAAGQACWPPKALRYGMSGEDVALLQAALAARGYGDAPGSFGDETRKRLMDFQRDSGLDCDGVAGPLSWAALLKTR